MDARAPISSPTAASSSSTRASPSNSFAPPQAPQQKSAGTDAFIRDLNLVAEAAKRAQMAVLMRDMEGFAIS
ncbi:Uu.00g103150.m01.CDS01 [Anthostomella pinea]|uniref:Uu.00g103150.m01.CDS01 n=1 Tax=Anthostomella pinea TaxID=933095 RepID=A0AAI8YFK3_9PEZI|nr:Uu.00g103150.m01.CDS01 [Anthostomella pinea]